MRHLPHLLVALCLALASFGCGEDAAADLDATAADLSGSCESACGGQSANGSCWCDDACEGYGDCCADKVDVCDADDAEPVASCAGACGGQSPSGACWCDDACESYGDCCEDKASACAAPAEVPSSCEDACGGQSPSGACWCDAHCAQYGDCCEDKVEVCDAPAEPEPEPVVCFRTGCSGHVCADEHVMTTCEFHPHYVCYQQAACEVQADGTCGFTKDDAFEACMAEHGVSVD